MLLLRDSVFFLNRNPIKIISILVTLSLSLYYYRIKYNFDGDKIVFLRQGSGLELKVRPLIFETLDTWNITGNSEIFINRFGIHKDGVLQRHPIPLPDNLGLLISPLNQQQSIPVGFQPSKNGMTRLLEMCKGSHWLEVCIFLTGLFTAYMTVLLLFRNFRKIGSKFSLACCVLLMTAMDLLFALAALERGLGITSLDPLILIEFGPMFISTVGFRKSYKLAKSIYWHRQKHGDSMGLLLGVNENLKPLLIDYVKEITLFSLFSVSGVSGLCEFSLLCVFILLADLLMTFTFFLGVIAFRMHLHVSRHEKHILLGTSVNDGPLKSNAKFIATVIFLALYAFNVLSTMTSKSVIAPPDFSKILPLILDHIGKDSTIVLLSPLFQSSISGDGCSIELLFNNIITRILTSNGDNSFYFFQATLFLALPLSLLSNIYLYKTVKTFTKTKGTIKESKEKGPEDTSEENILDLVKSGKLPLYALEKEVDDCHKAVQIRRKFLQSQFTKEDDGLLHHLPWEHYDYRNVLGTNCENVVGYIPIPVGVAGPLRIDEVDYYIPLSTTEGALVASTSRGCKAASYAGGVTTAVVGDGMTRGPVVKMPCLKSAVKLTNWIDSNLSTISQIFQGNSKYLELTKIDCKIIGRLIYLRFKAKTGDAMGMNMVSKATEQTLHFIHHEFPDMSIISLSGNFCSDKKAAAINWLDGRGKSVIAEAIIPGDILRDVLKTNVKDIVEVNIAKNLIGSMASGSSFSGCNAHAANIVAAMFIALGQDPAQVVSSSSCMTLMEPINNQMDLYISVTMPCIEVGAVGGGTSLPAQRSCLDLLSIKVLEDSLPGEASSLLARIIAGTVLAGELSLLASLSEGTLVNAHQALNRPKSLS